MGFRIIKECTDLSAAGPTSHPEILSGHSGLEDALKHIFPTLPNKKLKSKFSGEPSQILDSSFFFCFLFPFSCDCALSNIFILCTETNKFQLDQ